MHRILHITTLFDMFPDFNYGDNSQDEEHKSLQSSY